MILYFFSGVLRLMVDRREHQFLEHQSQLSPQNRFNRFNSPEKIENLLRDDLPFIFPTTA